MCGNHHVVACSAVGGLVKRFALGPVGRPAGDEARRSPLCGGEVGGWERRARGHRRRAGHCAWLAAAGAAV